MKKLLLSLLLLGGLTSQAQDDLSSENFESHSLGDVTTVFDGSLAGANGLFLSSSNGTDPTTTTNAGLGVAQIVDAAGDNMKVLQFAGPNGDKGGSFVWSDGLPDVWSNRTSGNDIISVSFKMYTGGATASKNRFGVYIYNSDFTKVLVGSSFNASTKELALRVYSTPGTNPVGNYTYTLLDSPGLVLASDTWVEITLTYDKATGRATIDAPGLDGGAYVNGTTVGLDPVEIDYFAFSGSATDDPNTASFSVQFDDLVVTATNDALSASQVTAIQESQLISTYPNPATDVLNINVGSLEVLSAQVVDLNGRVVLSTKGTSTLNVSALSQGAYLLTVVTSEGTTTQKFIKK